MHVSLRNHNTETAFFVGEFLMHFFKLQNRMQEYVNANANAKLNANSLFLEYVNFKFGDVLLFAPRQ